MNLQVFLVILSLFYCSCSELNPINEEKSVASSDYGSDSDSGSEYCELYFQGVGIVNERLNCYINALLYSLYNLPFFQRSVFKTISEIAKAESFSETGNSLDRHPLLLEMGSVFKTLRTCAIYESIDLSRSFLPAVEDQMKWPIGGFECVLEFWDKLIDSMPEAHKKPFEEVFYIKFKKNFYRKEDGKLIKSVPETGFTLTLPLKMSSNDKNMACNDGSKEKEQEANHDKQPEQEHDQEHDEGIIKLGDLFISSLNDEEMESFIISPEDQIDYPDLFNGLITEPQRIPVKSVIELENAPPVLVFGIKRLQMDPFTSELTYNAQCIEMVPFMLGSEEYIPISVVCFNCQYRHYTNINRDPIGKYLFDHNDEKVFLLTSESKEEVKKLNRDIGKSAVLVFCIKSSLWESEKDSIILEAEYKTDIQEAMENLENCKSLQERSFLKNCLKRIRRARSEDDEQEKEENESKIGKKSESSEASEETEVDEEAETEEMSRTETGPLENFESTDKNRKY